MAIDRRGDLVVECSPCAEGPGFNPGKRFNTKTIKNSTRYLKTGLKMRCISFECEVECALHKI